MSWRENEERQNTKELLTVLGFHTEGEEQLKCPHTQPEENPQL